MRQKAEQNSQQAWEELKQLDKQRQMQEPLLFLAMRQKSKRLGQIFRVAHRLARGWGIRDSCRVQILETPYGAVMHVPYSRRHGEVHIVFGDDVFTIVRDNVIFWAAGGEEQWAENVLRDIIQYVLQGKSAENKSERVFYEMLNSKRPDRVK